MIEDWARTLGATIDQARDIQFGRQYRLSRGDEKAIVNVYRGKAGEKVDVQMNGPLADALRALAAGRRVGDWAYWAGSDESGKGDYFGPLAVAGVALTREQAEKLASAGVRDSKTMSDGQALEADKKIRLDCLVRVVTLKPEEYNRAHEELGNVNRILGRAHGRVIAELAAAKSGLEAAVVDQFGDESYVADELASKGVTIRLIQRPRAESDLAVAAASVVARAAFLRGLAALEKRHGMPLPKGAGPDVIEAARDFVKRQGRDKLGLVAKLHFQTTASV